MSLESDNNTTYSMQMVSSSCQQPSFKQVSNVNSKSSFIHYITVSSSTTFVKLKHKSWLTFIILKLKLIN